MRYTLNRVIRSLQAAGFETETVKGSNQSECFVVWMVGTVEKKRRFINGVMV